MSLSTIDEVALECYSYLRDQKSHWQQVILGGWSYGGVVICKLAELLSISIEMNIYIQGILLFDTPLRTPVVKQNNENVISFISQSPNSIATRHFEYCTKMLELFYSRPLLLKPSLSCPIIDFRPIDSDYDCGLEAINELTNGRVIRQVVSGSHFTMLYDENAILLSHRVKEIIDNDFIGL